jgi:hypothetical protein
VTFAAPVALRMHREILASLADDDGRLPDGVPDWLAGLGAAVGEVAVEVAAAVRQAGRGLLSLVGQVAAEFERATRPAAPGAPPARAGASARRRSAHRRSARWRSAGWRRTRVPPARGRASRLGRQVGVADVADGLPRAVRLPPVESAPRSGRARGPGRPRPERARTTVAVRM